MCALSLQTGEKIGRQIRIKVLSVTPPPLGRIYNLLCVCVATLCGLGDLSSPTRDWTHAPMSGIMEFPTIGLPGKSQNLQFEGNSS